MKINNLYIYDFGKWQNKMIDFNQQSLITIIGNNEAGKSTLRGFILFMLFGLSPQQRQPYLPKHGGQLGGKLVVTTDDEETYTIERFHDRNNGDAICYDQAGQKLPSDWLTHQLNGVDRSLYNKIFNFDVFSLQVEGGLSREQLGQVLLSVGMTGSDRIYQAERQLNTFLQSKFKPKGTNPELNQILKQLVEKERQLKQLDDSIQVYEEHQRLRLTYQSQIREKQKELEQVNEQFVLYKEQERIYRSIEAYHLIVEQLSEFPKVLSFPEQGEGRYQQVKEQLQPLKADQQVAQQQLADLEEDLSQIEAELLSSTDRELILASLEQAAIYQEHSHENKHLQRQIDEKNQAIEQRITQLKLNLTEADIVELPINYTTSEIWQQLADQKISLNDQMPNLDQSLDKLKENEQQLEVKLSGLKEKTLAKLEKESFEKELEQIDRRFDQQSGVNADYFIQLKKRNRYINMISMGVMIVSLILMINEQTWFNWILFLTVLIVGSFFLAKQIKLRRKQIIVVDELAEQQLAQLINRRDELTQKIAQHEEHRDSVLMIEQELKQNKTEQLKLTEQLAVLKMTEQRTEQTLIEQQTSFPFLAHISVKYWPDLAKRLSEIIELIGQRKQLVVEQIDELEWMASFEEDILNKFNDFFKQDQLTFQQLLRQLQDISVQQDHLLEQKDKLQKRLNEQEKSLTQIKAKRVPYQEEMDQLLVFAGVDTEEQFIKRARQYEQWYALKEQREDLARQIKLHLPDHLVTDILSGHYLSISELEAKIKTNQEKITAINQELKELYQKEAEQHAILKQQEQSKKTLNLKHDYYFVKEKFNEEAKKWLTYQLALKQIEKTKEIFQTSYLPVVLDKTAKLLAKMTNHRYVKVEFDQEQQQLYLLTEDGEPYQVNELSQGTLDQLFIAIRLAISSWLAQHISLPFLIDDGFVHFDSQRQKQVHEILDELKDLHQVIYFTKTHKGFVQDKKIDGYHFIKLS
ncbi:AAA family ATPase [Amphibacillus sp. Q70]|uniref:AAA family ATPase n=1 Tax=Amphibacillus sp. Q70 TaxID=3453416 RepID=UPI003F82E080